MDTSLLEGLQITVIGMSVVVLFLITLVFVMIIVSKVVVVIDKIMPVVETGGPQTTQKMDNTKLAVAIAIVHLNNK